MSYGLLRNGRRFSFKGGAFKVFSNYLKLNIKGWRGRYKKKVMKPVDSVSF